MNRTGRIILGLVAAIAVLAVVILAYVYISGGSGEASREVESESVSAASSATVFEIMQDESEVRFILDEDLRGVRTTVTGRTNEVAGQIAVDFAAPANTELGEISINVRTLTTDNEFRNRAIKNRILETDAYELVTFVPTAINGLPEQVTLGEEMTFQIVGDLTIRNVTRPVTFDVTLVPVNDTRLEGKATTTLAYADFEIAIPAARAVSAVEDTVTLQLDFVATPV